MSMVLKMFKSPTCKPCAALAFALGTMKDLFEHNGVTFEQVDITQAPAEIERYGLRSTPTLVFEIDGQEAGRIVGMTTKAKVLDMLQGG